MLKNIFILFLSLMFATLSNAGLFSQNKSSFLPSNEAFILDFEQKNDQIKLTWHIAPNYYLYRDKIKVITLGEIKPFSLSKGKKHTDPFFGETEIYTDQLELNISVISKNENFDIQIEYQGCTEGLCYPPERKTIFFDAKKIVKNKENLTALNKDMHPLIKPISLYWFLILGIGLAFTPCVMPMLPLLSSIVIGQQQRPSTKRALLLSFSYVQGMALTYTLLGLLIVSIGLPFQVALQSPIVLISLSIIFVIFALSMFGLFEIKLPNSFQQKLHKLSQKQQSGSIKGVFFMGMIAGLIASPCTSAPLSSALLYVAQTGNFIIGGLALYLLALGMGIPLILITVFGNQILPKSGEWLVKVKIAFGFVMLALPIFLLSRILPQFIEPFLWSTLIIVFLIWLSFQLPKHHFIYKCMHILIFACVIISAKPYSALFWSNKSILNMQETKLHFIHIKTFADLQQKLVSYKGKKIMLDLYADWCEYCKKFEKETFIDPNVKQKLQQMVLLKIDLSQNTPQTKEIMNKLNALGLPLLLFFDEQGTELIQKRINGFRESDEFLEHLNSL